MARKTDLDKSLQQQVAKLTSPEERIYGDLKNISPKVKTDFALECVRILIEIANDAQGSSIDELANKNSRIVTLRKNVEASKLGKKEKNEIISMATKVQRALSSDLKRKTNIFKKANEIIGKLSSRVEGMVSTAFGDDPLMNLMAKGAVGGGSFIAEKIRNRAARRAANRDTLKGDAESLIGKAVRQTKAKPENIPPQPEVPPITPEPEPQEPKRKKIKPKVGEEQEGHLTAALQAMAVDIKDISKTIKTISTNVSSLYKLTKANMDKTQELMEDAMFDKAEQAFEAKKANFFNNQKSSGDNKTSTTAVAGGFFSNFFESLGDTIGAMLGLTAVGKSGKLAGLLKKIPGVSKALSIATKARGLFGAGLAMSGKLLGKATPFLGIVSALMDGVSGAQMADQMGLSKTSSFIGSALSGTFKSKIANIIVQALAFGGAGSVVGGPIGAIVGALIGGISGAIGKENIAKFLDSVGSMAVNMYEGLKKDFKQSLVIIKNMGTNIYEAFVGFGPFVKDKVIDGIDILKKTVVEVSDWMSKTIKEFWDYLKSMSPSKLFNDAKNVASNVANGVADGAKTMAQTTKNGFFGGMKAVSNAVSSMTSDVTTGFMNMFRSGPIDVVKKSDGKPTGKMKNISPDVLSAIKQVSSDTNTDLGMMLAVADSESGFNPLARNPGKGQTASGLYQFINSTAKNYLDKLGYDENQRLDPLVQAKMFAAYVKDNEAVLKKVKSGPLNSADFYMAHFLGGGGASKFFRNLQQDPSAIAANLFPKQAKVNKPYFYNKDAIGNYTIPKTMGEMYETIYNKSEGKASMYRDAFGGNKKLESTQAEKMLGIIKDIQKQAIEEKTKSPLLLSANDNRNISVSAPTQASQSATSQPRPPSRDQAADIARG